MEEPGGLESMGSQSQTQLSDCTFFLSFFLSFFVDSIFIITFHSNSFIYLYPLHPFIGWIFCNIKWKFTAISKANVCSSSSSTRRFHLNNYLHFSPSWITNGTIYTCTATLEQFKVFFSFFPLVVTWQYFTCILKANRDFWVSISVLASSILMVELPLG